MMKRRIAWSSVFLFMGVAALWWPIETAYLDTSPTPTAMPLPTFAPVGPMIVIESPMMGSDGRDEELFSDEDKIGETAHFEFYAPDGYFPVNLTLFRQQAERVYAEMQAQLGSTLNEKIKVAFEPPQTGPCIARGMALDGSPPRLIIFADETTSADQLLGVLSHEIAHLLHLLGYADAQAGFPALSEAIATWASRAYWNRWQGFSSLDDAVRSYLDEGTYLPLHENLYLEQAYSGDNCLEKRDLLYTEWASFVGFLIEQYGPDRLLELTATPTATRLPDFEAVYGLALNQLEAAWIHHLRCPACDLDRLMPWHKEP